MLLGKLGLNQHKIDCIIGAKEEERQKAQTIFVDIIVGTDFSQCVMSDQLEDTVSYEYIADTCTEVAQQGQFQLLEALAHAIIKKFVANKAILSIWVRVKKPLSIPSAEYAVVELFGGRDPRENMPR